MAPVVGSPASCHLFLGIPVAFPCTVPMHMFLSDSLSVFSSFAVVVGCLLQHHAQHWVQHCRGSTPSVALIVLIRGEGSLTWTCWHHTVSGSPGHHHCPVVSPCFVLLVTPPQGQQLKQFSVHLCVHLPSNVSLLLYKKLAVLKNTAKWWIYIRSKVLMGQN